MEDIWNNFVHQETWVNFYQNKIYKNQCKKK